MFSQGAPGFGQSPPERLSSGSSPNLEELRLSLSLLTWGKTTPEGPEALSEVTNTDINVSPRDRRSLDSDHDYCRGETPLSTINQAERRPPCWTVIHYYFN